MQMRLKVLLLDLRQIFLRLEKWKGISTFYCDQVEPKAINALLKSSFFSKERRMGWCNRRRRKGMKVCLLQDLLCILLVLEDKERNTVAWWCGVW